MILSAFLVVLLPFLTLNIPEAHTFRDGSKRQADKVVVCYMASWATHRPTKGKFTVNDVRADLCTHLIYTFAGLNATTWTIKSLDPWMDLKQNHDVGTYKKVTALRIRYPGLKVTLAIGGWNEGSENFSALVASPEKRNIFSKHVIEYLQMYGFDGLDLDWEFPGRRGGSDKDKENFSYFVRELKNAFERHGLLLTAAISGDRNSMQTSYDIPEISKYLDYIHVMAYDYHTALDKQVLPNAPVSSNDTLNLKDAIQYLLSEGAPSEKIVLGIPMYGRTFSLTKLPNTPDESPVGLPALEKGFPGPYTRENGFMGYNEICEELLNPSKGWRSGWDDPTGTPYAIKDNNVILYDNPRSIREKVDVINKMGLAGAMVWSMDTDDFHGNCAALHDFLEPQSSRDYPLLKTINMALGNTVRTYDEKKKKNHVLHSKISSAGTIYVSGFIIISMSLFTFLS
ncbi:probable chitinase 2 [Cephus cinctus]|uniref:Probable chitinase 2 n=1 Tax=Cephus cinctus TaxID=211228 RepID=A0AAJ7BYE9_CEPCN|nr:probable chitinase 2 [Cephus cinctus]